MNPPTIDVARALAWALLEVLNAHRDAWTTEQRELAFGVRALLELFDAEIDNSPRCVMDPAGIALARKLAGLLDDTVASQVRYRALSEEVLGTFARGKVPADAELRKVGLRVPRKRRKTAAAG